MALFDTISNLFKPKGESVDLTKVPQLQELPYSITDEPLIDPTIPAELQDRLPRLYEASRKRPDKQLVEQLRQLVHQYPNVPALKNYLMLAYNGVGNRKKVEEVLEQTLHQHPRYLLGLVNKANQMLIGNDVAGVEKLFGGPPVDLGALYPERTVFHLSELGQFNHVAFGYYIAKGNPAEAQNRLRLLRDIGYHPKDQLRDMKDRLDMAWLTHNMAKLQAGFAEAVSIDGYFRADEEQTTEPPVFEHAETQTLYQHGLAQAESPLPANKRDLLLALPRASLTRDLSKVLLDAVYRYEYFGEQDWDGVHHNFASHALLIATELRAAECLEAVLETLRQDIEFQEFWWGDMLHDFYEPYFRQILPAQADALQAFMQEPDINTYAKALVSESVAQVALTNPDFRPAAQAWFGEVLAFLLANADDDEQRDADLLAFLIGDITELQLVELFPQIRGAFERGLVNETVSGDLTYIQEEMLNPAFAPELHPLLPLAEQYEYFRDPSAYQKAHPRPVRQQLRDDVFTEINDSDDEWTFLDDDDQESLPAPRSIKSSPFYIPDQKPRQVAPAPGRNDKVTVKYTNGKIMTDVKYKKVEADVKAGKCVLV